MALQAKLGAGILTAAGLVWAGVVYRERHDLPVGRRRRFSPGSADDVMSVSLKEGDLVLFSRNCALYYPCGAAACLGAKAASGQEYDHAGIIVRHRGETCIAEAAFGAVRLRSFEERVVCSRAYNVVVRQLAKPLTPEQRDALRRATADAVEGGGGSSEGPVAWATAVVRHGPAGAGLKVPGEFASSLYRAAGMMTEEESLDIASAGPSFMAGGDRTVRKVGSGVELAGTLWFRDRTA